MKTAHRVLTLSFSFITLAGTKTVRHVDLPKTRAARVKAITKLKASALEWESQRQGRKVYVWAKYGFSQWRLSKADDVLARIA